MCQCHTFFGNRSEGTKNLPRTLLDFWCLSRISRYFEAPNGHTKLPLMIPLFRADGSPEVCRHARGWTPYPKTFAQSLAAWLICHLQTFHAHLSELARPYKTYKQTNCTRIRSHPLYPVDRNPLCQGYLQKLLAQVCFHLRLYKRPIRRFDHYCRWVTNAP